VKSYSFRLGTVLRVRRVETLLARQSVGVAARVLASALVREQEMVDIYEQAARPRGELDGAAFVACLLYTSRCV